MNHIESFLDKLNQQNIHLWLENHKLRYRAPKGVFPQQQERD